MISTNYSTWNKDGIYPDFENDGAPGEKYIAWPKLDGSCDVDAEAVGHAALVTAGWIE